MQAPRPTLCGHAADAPLIFFFSWFLALDQRNSGTRSLD